MKIGDKITIDKDFYIKKYKETHGVDAVASDDMFKEIEILDITTKLNDVGGVVIYVHFENFVVDVSFIKTDDVVDIRDVLYDIFKRLHLTLENKIKIRKNLENRILNDIRNSKKLFDNDLNAIHCLTITIDTLTDILKNK